MTLKLTNRRLAGDDFHRFIIIGPSAVKLKLGSYFGLKPLTRKYGVPKRRGPFLAAAIIRSIVLGVLYGFPLLLLYIGSEMPHQLDSYAQNHAACQEVMIAVLLVGVLDDA